MDATGLRKQWVLLPLMILKTNLSLN